MAFDLVLGQPHHLAGRDRHAVEAEATWVDAEIVIALVLLAQAEVLPRLGWIPVDPELERGLLGPGEGASDPAGSAEHRVDVLREPSSRRRGLENGRDLDSDLPAVHESEPNSRARPRSTHESLPHTRGTLTVTARV